MKKITIIIAVLCIILNKNGFSQSELNCNSKIKKMNVYNYHINGNLDTVFFKQKIKKEYLCLFKCSEHAELAFATSWREGLIIINNKRYDLLVGNTGLYKIRIGDRWYNRGINRNHQKQWEAFRDEVFK